jgi:hypothetical protein
MGAAQVGAAGAAHVGAAAQQDGAQQRFFLHLSFTLANQSFRPECFLTLPQQWPQGLQHAAGAAQLGAGAAQVGAAAGAQQLGAAAAGAAHDGAGAAQVGAGAQPQQSFFLLNRPASAEFRPAKHTSKAGNQTKRMTVSPRTS